MKYKNLWDKIFFFQLILTILCEIYLVVEVDWNKVSYLTLNFDSGILAITIVSTVLFLFMKIKPIALINKWLMAIFLPYILCYTLNTIFFELFATFKELKIVFLIIFIVLFLVVLIPFITVIFPLLKNAIERIIGVITVTASLLMNCYFSIKFNMVLDTVLKSQFLAAIAIIILAYFFTKAWGFKYRANLKFQKSTNLRLFWLIAIIAFSIWYSFFGTFLLISDNFWNAIAHWDFNLFNFTWRSALMALEPAILEEIFRYLLLLIIVFALKDKKYCVPVSVILSAIIFSLMHFSNISSGNTSAIIVQVIYTLGLGILAPILYFYVGKLWLVIIIHFIIDFLQFSRSYLALAEVGYISTEVYLAIIVLLPTMVAIIMMFGNTRLVMNENAMRLLK